MTGTATYCPKFREFLSQEIALKAAKPLSEGVEIGFIVQEAGNLGQSGNEIEQFFFKKTRKEPAVSEGPAPSPELCFYLTPMAAQEILDNPSTDIGEMGVRIAKLIVSSDPNLKIKIKLKTSVFGLFAKGFFGVIATGGSSFAAFLASRGLNGLDGIKSAIKGLRG